MEDIKRNLQQADSNTEGRGEINLCNTTGIRLEFLEAVFFFRILYLGTHFEKLRWMVLLASLL